MPKPRIDESKVIEAALEEFTSFSYEEASLNRIIKKAGISKGSFYYRFETKYDIYLHLMKEGTKRKWDFIRLEMEKSPESDKEEDIFSLFLSQTEMGIQFACSHPEYHKLAKMFSREKGSDIYKYVLREIGGSDDTGIQKVIDRAMEKGDFSNRFSRDFISKIISFMFQSYDEIFDTEGRDDLENTLDRMKDLVDFLKFGLAEERGTTA